MYLSEVLLEVTVSSEKRAAAEGTLNRYTSTATCILQQKVDQDGISHKPHIQQATLPDFVFCATQSCGQA
jgi:hypothetical protein